MDIFICLVFAMSLCASVYMCFVVTCWERADLLALVCGSNCQFVTFPWGILGQVWYVIVSIPDLCTLTYFKSNLEFRYQIIVLSIKLRNFAKLMIPIALFKKFPSEQFIASVEVSKIARCSSKTNELRDIDSIGCRARNITI